MIEERFKRKEVPTIITEAFSERLAKGFVGISKLSVLQWESEKTPYHGRTVAKLGTISVGKGLGKPSGGC